MKCHEDQAGEGAYRRETQVDAGRNPGGSEAFLVDDVSSLIDIFVMLGIFFHRRLSMSEL